LLKINISSQITKNGFKKSYTSQIAEIAHTYIKKRAIQSLIINVVVAAFAHHTLLQ